MTDDRAEKAFHDALNKHADDAGFEPLRLSAPPRRRWPGWLPAAAVIVLVAAIAVPLLIGRLGGDADTSAAPIQHTAAAQDTGGEGGPAASTAASSPLDTLPAARPGWRWESYRVLAYQVPATWDYDQAPGSDWCSARSDRPSTPFVDLAAGPRPVSDTACPRTLPASRLTMFVAVRKVGAPALGWDRPPGWKLTAGRLDGYQLDVVHPVSQADLAAQIVATVRALPEVDGNGCPSASPFSGPTAAGRTLFSGLVRASVCQYDLSAPGLIASRTEDALSAARLRDTLSGAPAGSGPDDPSCTASGTTAILVRLWGPDDTYQDVLVRYSGCRGNGIVGLGEPRRLTEDLCLAVFQAPIVFTGGHGATATLCTGGAVGPTPSPRPTRTR